MLTELNSLSFGPAIDWPEGSRTCYFCISSKERPEFSEVRLLGKRMKSARRRAFLKEAGVVGSGERGSLVAGGALSGAWKNIREWKRLEVVVEFVSHGSFQTTSTLLDRRF